MQQDGKWGHGPLREGLTEKLTLGQAPEGERGG